MVRLPRRRANHSAQVKEFAEKSGAAVGPRLERLGNNGVTFHRFQPRKIRCKVWKSRSRCDYILLALEAAEKDKPNHGTADLVEIHRISCLLSDRRFRRY